MLVTLGCIFRRSIIFSLFLFTASASAGVFQIVSLTDANPVIIDHNAVTGDDDGTIAVSDTKVFYDGDGGTGHFNITDLTGGTDIGTRYGQLTSDLATSQVYVLGTDATTPTVGDNTTGTVTHLLEIDGNTGALTGTSIPLSSSIVLTNGTGIFAGHERVVIHDTQIAFDIEIPSGTVTNLGAVALSSPQTNEIGSFIGVAEYDGTDISLVYINTNNQDILRTNVTSGISSVVANFPAGLSDMAGFAVSPANNRWYFHHESSSGTFGGASETLGFADATFITSATSAAPIPTMSFWGLAMLISLLGAFGFVRRRHPV